MAIGTDLEGRLDVLGIWLGSAESSKCQLLVLNGLKSRGVRDMLIASVDRPKGLVKAIDAAFPRTEIHQRRNRNIYKAVSGCCSGTQSLVSERFPTNIYTGFFRFSETIFSVLFAIEREMYMDLHDGNDSYAVMYHHIINIKYYNILAAFD